MKYKLKNGKTLIAISTMVTGMAGEPMQTITLLIDGKHVRFADIKHLMNSNQASDLGETIEDIAEDNLRSAIEFTI